jgi:hypothetical protein
LRAIHFLIDHPVIGGNHENPSHSTHPWSLLIVCGARLQQARRSARFERLTVLQRWQQQFGCAEWRRRWFWFGNVQDRNV